MSRAADGAPKIDELALISACVAVVSMAAFLILATFGFPGGLTLTTSIVAVLSGIALAAGIVSVVRMRRSKDRIVGNGLAMWAITIGGVMFIAMTVIATKIL